MKSATLTNYDPSDKENSEFEDLFDFDEESFEEEDEVPDEEESDDEEDYFFRPLDEY
ncbi:MAG: hypothetical protein RIM99_07545 [Cyclobacteriaceae bacterium]